MSDMELIMENWRGYLSEADLDPCPKQPIDLGEFKVALDIASSDSDIQKEKIDPSGNHQFHRPGNLVQGCLKRS